MKTYFSNPTSRKGAFSLIELLVIAAVISVLASLFFVSALGRARQQASESICLNNLRHLTLGWQMYVSDNHGDLPSNNDGSSQPSFLTSSQYPQWCPGRMDSGSIPPGQPTNVAWLKIGQIYPYVGSPAYYRCPADVSTYYTGTAFPTGGKGNPRVRSYSMNTWISPSTQAVTDFGLSSVPYRIYRQQTDLVVPGAANLLLLADENPYSINDPMFWEQPQGSSNPPTTTEWGDIPAVWHSGAGGLSFSDGHVQMRLWSEPALYSSRGGALSNPSFSDLSWLIQRCTARK
jgi:type II secretory pathway pseudopilin PulG